MRGSVRRKKKSALSIKIKPFSKPPTLPPNFYESSSLLLWSSLQSILERRSTLIIPSKEKGVNVPPSLTTGIADPVNVADLDTVNSGVLPMPSREELFGKVQDLCTHGFGPKLYKELIGVMNQAAFTCVSRLVQNDVSLSDTTSSSLDGSKYPTKNCVMGLNRVYFSSLDEEYPVSEGSVILNNVWTMYSDYLQFLNCVRNVFLSLDRMFLYLPPGAGQVDGKVLLRNASGSSASPSLDNMGESSQGDGYLDFNATAISAWDLWDVGMHSLYKHLALNTTDIGVARASTSINNGMERTSLEQKSPLVETMKYSILHTLKVRTIKCILAELDMLPSRPDYLSTSNDINMDEKEGGISHSEFLHKSLVRNCVSIFRSLAHVSNYEASNVNKNLLEDLVQEMTSYLNKESLRWMSDSDLNSLAPSKTSYNSCSLLRHIDKRIEQVNRMTTYYHLASDSTADMSSTGMMASQPRRNSRLLTHLVEEFLLTPHFTTQLILHPSNLYPILDQEEDSSFKYAGLLFNLSKRIVQPSQVDNPVGTKNTFSSPGMELLRQAFEAYGKERGMAIMRPTSTSHVVSPMGTGVKPPPQLTMREMNNKVVTNLLEYKSHLEYLQRESFNGDEFFEKTCKKVLEDVLNDSGITDEFADDSRRRGRYGNTSDGGKRIAELLAKFMDMMFKNPKASLALPLKRINPRSPISISSLASSTATDNGTELFQTAVLDLFRHIQSKDVFEAFYRQDLAKRLLLNKSSSVDAERSFVSKLKSECGTGYTSKMEGMFKDMELSKDVMSSYSAHLAGSKLSLGSTLGKVDMDVQVLTTGYWPVHTQYPSLILPSVLESKKSEFDAFYNLKYQGRRITWQNGLGNCIVRAHFPKITGPRELNVSLCQALVLLCFNIESAENDVQLTIGEVMKKTGIEDRGEAERVLQSLSMGREGTQVLRRLDTGSKSNDKANTESTPRKKHKSARKAVADSDLFIFNTSFTSNQRRIRITNIQMKETARDRKKTHESVILDRLHLIDAALVRIMKARKSLEHRDLVGETMNQLKFPASGVDIKKRIESLIEREYLERAEGEASRYNYLA